MTKQANLQASDYYNDFTDLIEKSVKRDERRKRLGAKRRLLLRLAACRDLGVQPILNDQEAEIYRSMLKWWQRIFVEAASLGEQMIDMHRWRRV